MAIFFHLLIRPQGLKTGSFTIRSEFPLCILQEFHFCHREKTFSYCLNRAWIIGKRLCDVPANVAIFPTHTLIERWTQSPTRSSQFLHTPWVCNIVKPIIMIPPFSSYSHNKFDRHWWCYHLSKELKNQCDLNTFGLIFV